LSSQGDILIPAAKPATPRPSSRLWKELFFQVALPLMFAAIILFFFPHRARFEFSSDEGINLMKSMLMSKGYHLYGEIWSDQPPLFSYLLMNVVRITGNSVAPARMLVLVFSCALLWAAIQFLRLSWGDGPALVGAILFFFLPRYLFLSFAVMIGLPAISLAMLSLLFLAYWHDQRKWFWLVLSAVFLALSVLIKLFTGLLAPIFVAGLLLHELQARKGKSWLQMFSPALLWGSIFGLLAAGLGLGLVGWDNLPQLLDAHLAATNATAFDQPEFTLAWNLRAAVPILVLGAIGTVFAVLEKRWLSLYLTAWASLAYLAFFKHTPIWEHHQLLITIPAAMLAAVPVYKLLRLIIDLVRTHLKLNFVNVLLAFSLVAFMAYFFPYAVKDPVDMLSPLPSLATNGLGLTPNPEKGLRIMLKYAPQSTWMVTDMPMAAFRANLLVPPNLAVFTAKRYASGFLTQEDIIAAVKEYQPEQILFGRNEYPLVETFLQTQNYQLVFEGGLIKLYIRKDLLR
jgi:4-amino-4-deoxy-L-arabinose transferase-like glycosyltransferase